MKNVTINMIDDFKIKELGCDFMGYKVDRSALRKDSSHPIQFHHLRIARRDCGNMPDLGYNEWNGALLIGDSHEELHKIEHYEREIFDRLTELMVRMNDNGRLDKETLLEIRNELEYFEFLYQNAHSKSGSKVVKNAYKTKKMTLEEIDNAFSKGRK